MFKLLQIKEKIPKKQKTGSCLQRGGRDREVNDSPSGHSTDRIIVL